MHRWWKANRAKAPNLFALELAEARQQIAKTPDIGQVYAARAGGVIVRRVLMPKTRTHVFYEVMENEGMVMIVALWGATKEHGPGVGRQ
jgi:plasmid stabilization system protein ParE